MKLHVNKNTKLIEGYTLAGTPVGDYDYFDVDFTEDTITEDLFFSRYVDGNIVLDEELKRVEKDSELLAKLRAEREVECFPIINRGQLWYANLTPEQLAELDVWYKNWLNVTETKIVPEKPDWLV